MKRLNYTILITLIAISLAISYTSCTSTSELLPLSELPVRPVEASADDYETMSNRISDLEMRVERLEQGLDERVVEFNMVQSALWEMVIENKFNRIPGDSFPYTNDMRQFPSPTAPLYGFDKNNDGKPDTNYIPFEKTVWFYKADDYVPDLLIQGPDPKLIENLDAGRGIDEMHETELHNIQTAVMAMLADSKAGILDSVRTNVTDMDIITTDGGTMVLSNYMTGLNPDGTVKSGCIYSFTIDGTVTQTTPINPPQETYESELHNIQTAVMAMLADSKSGILDANYIGISDLDSVTTDNGDLVLSNYITGVNIDGTVKSGCTYDFHQKGTVTQNIP
jgi:hypothetical protein